MRAYGRGSSRIAGGSPGDFISTVVLGFEAQVAETATRGKRKRDDKQPPGPKYKAWQDRYKQEIGKELRKKGFTPNEIEKIVEEFGGAIAGLPKLGKMYKFIAKQLKRIYDAWDAIRKARKTVGEPPPYNE